MQRPALREGNYSSDIPRVHGMRGRAYVRAWVIGLVLEGEHYFIQHPTRIGVGGGEGDDGSFYFLYHERISDVPREDPVFKSDDDTEIFRLFELLFCKHCQQWCRVSHIEVLIYLRDNIAIQSCIIGIGRDEYDTRRQGLYHGIATHIGGQEDQDIGRNLFEEFQEAIRSSQSQCVDPLDDEDIVARARTFRRLFDDLSGPFYLYSTRLVLEEENSLDIVLPHLIKIDEVGFLQGIYNGRHILVREDHRRYRVTRFELIEQAYERGICHLQKKGIWLISESIDFLGICKFSRSFFLCMSNRLLSLLVLTLVGA